MVIETTKQKTLAAKSIIEMIEKYTVAESEARNEVVIVERGQNLANYGNGLLVRVWLISELVQALTSERVLPFKKDEFNFIRKFGNFIAGYVINFDEPVHSLLLVKSIPTIRFDDSNPASLRAAVTCRASTPTDFLAFGRCS